MKREFLATVILFAVAISACNKQPNESVSEDKQVKNAVTLEQKKPYTSSDWERDFSSTFVASKKDSDGEGISSYKACFGESDGKCDISMSGRRDAFRKVDQLTPVLTVWQKYAVRLADKGRSASFVDLRVVAPNCREAVVVLNPTLNASKWLFMDKIGFMGDGVLLYEKNADHQAVSRDVDGVRVWESWSFKLEQEDYEKIAQFSSAKEKVIRLTGEKGYFTMEKDSVDVFGKEIPEAIKVANKINDALKSGGGPTCAM